MLERLDLANFRAFESSVSIRLRPITILIGQNSSGKSSVIKFLLMLKQTLMSPSTAYFTSDADDLHLGTMSHLRNRKARSKYLSYELVATGEQSNSLVRAMKVDRGGRDLTISLSITFPGLGDLARSEDAGQEPAPVPPADMKVSFIASGKVSYGEAKESDAEDSIRTLDANGVEVARLHRRLKPGLRFLAYPSNRAKHEESYDSIAAVDESIKRALPVTMLEQELRRVAHISAVREEFQRVVALGSVPPHSVGARGQYTVPQLQLIADSDSPASKFVSRHLSAVAQLGLPDFKPVIDGYLSTCEAQNENSGAQTLLADYGFGVSQALPIILQAAIAREHSLLLVEQPEAHLHPTAQLAMGQVFAEAWLQNKVQSIVETHSANVLLRLRRLVANGTLQASDVSVAYFSYQKKRVVVSNLDVLPNGNLSSGLPLEFFGADLQESLEMRAKV